MELTANAVQIVAADQNVLFTDTAVKGNCSMLHRDGSGLVTLRGITDQCRARYKISFSANVAIPTGGTVGPISLAIAINGEGVGPATMISTPAAVETYNNVATGLFIDVPVTCCSTISVVNLTDEDISVQNANLIVERVA
jgi:hypothetical protein